MHGGNGGTVSTAEKKTKEEDVEVVNSHSSWHEMIRGEIDSGIITRMWDKCEGVGERKGQARPGVPLAFGTRVICCVFLLLFYYLLLRATSRFLEFVSIFCFSIILSSINLVSELLILSRGWSQRAWRPDLMNSKGG